MIRSGSSKNNLVNLSKTAAFFNETDEVINDNYRLKDKELISVAKDYYTEREGKSYGDKEAIDKFSPKIHSIVQLKDIPNIGKSCLQVIDEFLKNLLFHNHN